MKVLEIGPNLKPQAQMIWPDAEIVTLDIDPELKPDIVADAAHMPEELTGQFDAILASHVLEHFSYWNTGQVLAGWIECLKDGGELHVVVPSLEWAAREVLSEKPSQALLPHLFAGQVNQWDLHWAAFTLRKLRADMERAGLNVKRAKTGPYHITVAGTVWEAEQHYVMGVKGHPGLAKE